MINKVLEKFEQSGIEYKPVLLEDLTQYLTVKGKEKIANMPKGFRVDAMFVGLRKLIYLLYLKKLFVLTSNFAYRKDGKY
jgi:hypothetical protein